MIIYRVQRAGNVLSNAYRFNYKNLIDSNLCNFKVCKKALKTVNQCLQKPVMKLSIPQLETVITDDVKYLKYLFDENGFEIRIAGGAVRDLLLGNIPKDIDFATTATPNEMKDLFNKHQIRLINARGESHGTITPRINNANYEITTLRIDEITDGRHATVKFTTNWFLDASRRDLTINAMFLDFDGNLYDFFNGIEDLKNRRVLFVGDAGTRIQEDYLRILRYFRFYGRISDKPDKHDEATLTAIKENVEGLQKISGERIWSELNKILTGNYVKEILKTILSLGIGPYIGLPVKCNIDELERVLENTKSNNLVLDPITILSSLLYTTEDAQNLISRIKPSSEIRELANFIVQERSKGMPEQPVKYYQKLQILSNQRKFIKRAIEQLLAYIGDIHTLKDLEKFACDFPINGQDILNKGVEDRRQVGYILKELQIIWIDNDCKLTKEQLEEKIPEVAGNFFFDVPKNIKKRKKGER